MSDEDRRTALETALRNGGDGVCGKITAAIKAHEEFSEGLADITTGWDAGDRKVNPNIGLAASRAAICARTLKDLVTRLVLSPQGEAARPERTGETIAEAVSRGMLPCEAFRARREATETAVRLLDEQLADFNADYLNLKKNGGAVDAETLRHLETGLTKAKKMLADVRGGIE